MSSPEYLRPTSELEAVNAMLASIGEAPVNSLEDTGVLDAVQALATLRSVSREVQSKGWHFNTEVKLLLARDELGQVRPPANALRIDTVYTSADLDVAHRGTRLYDRGNHTYTFEVDLVCDVVVLLPFDELPEAARQYIFLRAGRRYQDGSVGDSALHRFQERDEMAAMALLSDAESETADHNILTGSWAVNRIINRRVAP